MATPAFIREATRTTRHGLARVRFALAGPTTSRVLRQEQIARFRADGCLVVSGLVPRDVVIEAAEALHEAAGSSPSDPATWARLGPRPQVLADDRILATWTDAVLGAAAELAGGHVAGFDRPREAFTINRPPGGGPWRPHGAHLDFSLAALRHRSRPLPFRIGALTYLSDVARHGGGTLVWPGSHRVAADLVSRDPRRFEYLHDLSVELGRVDLGPFIELTPSAGDVLFFHPLLVHASSENVSDTPRLALNHKW